ncbi:glycosyltransferase family 1 protein [Haloferax sp. Atlit-10N]|uniref:glycosyltransferase family 4 protein n=1 Tax=unclassified Haloferax TaxID=2625095 RepID=UPI000E233154|nr:MULTISPECIES: glycosyltransferase family 4 protein [unclassified Haloferax]RDZ44869.1 glycosyltransferase family 1 protein [Haloferax sp. Atlit-16N]RDZ59353.1 glycosyltransferase family 1 protein [Haloferax sp. Atlit-10N]
MDESLRICILSKQFPPGVGGGETYAYELANGLGKRGHDVDVYTQWIDDPNETVETQDNVTVHRICKARKKLVTFETIYFSYKARKAVDFEEYDIVHGTLMPASTIAVTPFNDIDTPVVVTSHGTSIGETKAVALETPADYLLKFFFHPMNVVMDYFAGHDADKVIAISDHAYEQLTTSYGLDVADVEMIPHGVDTDWFYPRDEQHPAVDPDKTTLLYVGRLGARKGLRLGLQAVAQVNDPNLEFLIAGTGRHEERLRDLAAELGIENRIRFLGYVADEELPKLYSSADVFILPSRYEGFGLVLLEAVACGTPVIGVDAGGIPTAVQEDSGIVARRDVGSVARAITALCSDESTRRNLTEATLNDSTSLSWESAITKVERVYSKEVM